jgi:hypothetical protein
MSYNDEPGTYNESQSEHQRDVKYIKLIGARQSPRLESAEPVWYRH